MPIEFKPTTVTNVPRGNTRENEFLPVVQALTVVNAADKEKPGVEFLVPLVGTTRPVGAAKNDDGTEIPPGERRQEDTAVIDAKRDLDNAGTSLTPPVTVRKVVTLGGLRANGEFNPEAKKLTHAHFKVYATAKQTRSRAAETPETAATVTPVSE